MRDACPKSLRPWRAARRVRSDRFIADSPFPGEHRRDALLHFGQRDIFLVHGHRPEMTERNFKLAGTVALKLTLDSLAFFGTDGQRTCGDRVHTLHIKYGC
jgi:hypothetical protein